MQQTHPTIRASLAFLLILLLITPFQSPGAAAGAAAPTPLFAVAAPPLGKHACTRDDPCTLQEAVNSAEINATIYAAGGKYTSSASQVLNLNKTVRIQGGWDGRNSLIIVVDPRLYHTSLDGEAARLGINISGNVSPTLLGLTILNGKASAADGGKGGGIYIGNSASGDVRVDNCIIHNNQADWYGGGIYLTRGSLTVTNSRISNNTVVYGGAAFFAAQGSSMTIESSDVYGNSGSYGDLVDIDQANFTARGNYIHDHHHDAPTDRSIISHGGNTDLHAILENNIFANNDARVFLSYATADITIVHNTFANHQNDGLSFGAASYTGSVRNNIFTGLQGASIIQTAGSSLVIDHNLFWQNESDPNKGSASLLADPLLTTNFHIGRGSPAIDAAAATSVTSDYDGHARPIGAAADIGADESLLYVDLPFISR